MPTSSGSTARPAGWRTCGPGSTTRSATNAGVRLRGHLPRGCGPRPRWDFKVGSPLGTGGQWAIPWGFENNVVAYNKAVLRREGHQAGRHLRRTSAAGDRPHRPQRRPVRRRVPWLEVVGHDPPRFHHAVLPHGRQGLPDPGRRAGPADGHRHGDPVHRRSGWSWPSKAGPTSWTTYEYPDCTRRPGRRQGHDGLRRRLARRTRRTRRVPARRPGTSPGTRARPGRTATTRPTCGPGRWPMNATSKQQAGGVAVHPVGHRQGGDEQGGRGRHVRRPGAQVGVRRRFKQVAARPFPGYLETFEKVIGASKIQFTPQKKFFETTQDWAVALQDIYGGDDAAVAAAKTCAQDQHRQGQPLMSAFGSIPRHLREERRSDHHRRPEPRPAGRSEPPPEVPPGRRRTAALPAVDARGARSSSASCTRSSSARTTPSSTTRRSTPTRTSSGSSNFESVLSDQQFWTSVRVTAMFAVVATAVETVLGVAVALLLNRSSRDRQDLREGPDPAADDRAGHRGRDLEADVQPAVRDPQSRPGPGLDLRLAQQGHGAVLGRSWSTSGSTRRSSRSWCWPASGRCRRSRSRPRRWTGRSGSTCSAS